MEWEIALEGEVRRRIFPVVAVLTESAIAMSPPLVIHRVATPTARNVQAVAGAKRALSIRARVTVGPGRRRSDSSQTAKALAAGATGPRPTSSRNWKSSPRCENAPMARRRDLDAESLFYLRRAASRKAGRGCADAFWKMRWRRSQRRPASWCAPNCFGARAMHERARKNF